MVHPENQIVLQQEELIGVGNHQNLVQIFELHSVATMKYHKYQLEYRKGTNLNNNDILIERMYTDSYILISKDSGM